MTHTSLDIHTSDLTEPCMRKVRLRHLGHCVGETTTALYRGLLFHEAVGMLHRGADSVHEVDFAALVASASERVTEIVNGESRPMSVAVLDKLGDLLDECEELLAAYWRRLADDFRWHRLIGTELPVRWRVDVDGEEANFASHIDYLARDKRTGGLVLRDWKTQEDVPTAAYLARNLQLGLYAVAVARGVVLVNGEWIEFGEWPTVQWVHVNHLMPYKRGCEAKDENGEVVKYAKGDERPLSAIVKDTFIGESGEAAIVDEFSLRVRMWRAGMFPARPDVIGCHLCECRAACETYTNRE